MDTTNTSGGSTSSGPINNPSNLKEVQTQITSALASADSSAAQSVQRLNLVHQARLSGLKRTAASAVAQYGANSTQAQQAEAAVTATSTTISRIAVLQNQQSTPVPKVSASGWALHGRVYDAQLQPRAQYTVFLVDAKKTFQQAYGFAYTDETGYFLINYAGEAAQSGAAPAAPQLYIEVVNAKAEPVYLSATVFGPAPGSVTYQNITLPAGESPLGDPPDAIRKVALPGEKPK